MKTKLLLVAFASFLFPQNHLSAQTLKGSDRKKILKEIPELISEHYAIEGKRKPFSKRLKDVFSSDTFLGITDSKKLESEINSKLYEITKDKHVYLRFVKDEGAKGTDWDAWEQRERRLEIEENYGLSEVKILEGNIGYLKITEFMHPGRSIPTVVASMKFLENTKALIIDIRDNGGGYGETMEYVLNHFFDGGPEHIATTYYADENKIPYTQYSSPAIYGKNRTNTPLIIITNGETGSAAEFFAYTLQAFGKAKILGEASTGAANRNSYFPLTENFKFSVSTAIPVNPITKTNWEGGGVIPDHKVSDDEIEEARKILTSELSR